MHLFNHLEPENRRIIIKDRDIKLHAEREQLQTDGFCIVKGILQPDDLAWVRDIASKMISGLSEEHRGEQKSAGSMVASGEMPELIDLYIWPAALQALADLGFDDNKFVRAYLISKPPHSPRLFWHQDLTVWKGEPRAYSDLTPQLFLMYYLSDTTRKNGCLRVLPGSHRRRHALHEFTGVAHNAEDRAAVNLASPIFREYEAELDVLVKAGDLVIGDSRTLHASHDNDSDQERTVITLFYHPSFSQLIEPTQKQYTDLAEAQIRDWPPELKKKLAPHIANYSGPAEALKRDRVPGPQLS